MPIAKPKKSRITAIRPIIMPLFKKLVEVGRVCFVNYGPDYGKLCVIVDVIDSNRALVDGPSDVTGVARQALPFKWLQLTHFTVKISKGARLGALKKAFAEAKIQEKWAATRKARVLALNEKRRNLTDFQRFELVKARRKRTLVLRKELSKLRKEHNSNPANKDKKLTRSTRA
jgi:large subunit ribosomal protein L14e